MFGEGGGGSSFVASQTASWKQQLKSYGAWVKEAVHMWMETWRKVYLCGGRGLIFLYNQVIGALLTLYYTLAWSFVFAL